MIQRCSYFYGMIMTRRYINNRKVLVIVKGVLVQNVFVLDQAVEMVETIIRMGQKYATITETIKKQRDLPLSEVTAKNYRDMDIEELLENIAMLESKMEAEPSISVINLLMNLYQKVTNT
jgi:heterodisulfide reductase subunit C